MGAVSEQKAPPPRPPQVMVACSVAVLGSVFAILLMWERISGLHGLATRQALQSFLDHSRLGDDGATVGDLATTVKVLSMVCAACGVAIAVQAWQAARRSRSARVALSVLAGPLFVTGLVSDGILGSAAATFWCTAVSAAVVTLWLGPNRVWYGDPPRAARPVGPPPPHLRTPMPPLTERDPRVPPPTASPYATPPPGGATQTTALPPAGWAPPPTSVYDERRPAGARPRALLWACVLTWVCTGIAATGLALSLVVLSSDSHSVLDDVYRRNPQFADQGLSRHAVLAMLIALSGFVLVAALAAAVFAVLLFLRRRWAWYALVVSASAATLLFLVGSFGSPVAIVMLGASVATIACLVRPEVRAWLVRR